MWCPSISSYCPQSLVRVLTSSLRKVKAPESQADTAGGAFKDHMVQLPLSQMGSGGPERTMTCPRLHSKPPTTRARSLVGSCLVMRLMGTKAVLAVPSMPLTGSPLRQGRVKGQSLNPSWR